MHVEKHLQKRAHITLLWIFLWSAVGVRAYSAELTGKVVRVIDGDTLVVLEGKTQRKIRLLGIDAPEKNQAFNAQAKQALSDLTFGKLVRVTWKSKDRYDRVLGNIHVGDEWINRTLVENGMAWAYRSSTPKEIKEAEASARTAKRGLWIEKNPIPPWDFRSKRHSAD